jgi:cytochrome c-type biogenesis protein CcmH/NrfG
VDPGAPAPWIAVADYAARAGRHDEATDALRRAAELPGAPPDAYARRIAELEAAKATELKRALERRALRGMDGVVGP